MMSYSMHNVLCTWKKRVASARSVPVRNANHREHTPQPDLSSEYKVVMAQAGSATFFQCARWRSFTEDLDQGATNDATL